jgi:hypothetical protein
MIAMIPARTKHLRRVAIVIWVLGGLAAASSIVLSGFRAPGVIFGTMLSVGSGAFLAGVVIWSRSDPAFDSESVDPSA